MRHEVTPPADVPPLVVHRMSDGQAADYNQGLAAVLEAYDLLGEVVLSAPPPPGRGWNAPQQINDIYERLWFALEKLAAIEPQVVAKARRQRIGDPTRGTPTPRAGWPRL